MCCLGIGLFSLSVGTYARNLVIAFDNTLQPSTSLDAKARSQMIVRNLANAQVPQAMFLIKTYGLTAKDEARIGIYSDEGHLLVSMGHGQHLLSRPDLYAFEISILKSNKILQPYFGYKKHVLLPYLHQRGDRSLQQGLKEFLRERHYRPAYTGYDLLHGADAYMNQLYQERVLNNRRIDIVRLEKAYVDYVADALKKQDAIAFGLLGYSPTQILVLQENDLAAYFIAAVVERLQQEGWTFIEAEKAFSDPIGSPLLNNGFGANDYMNAITGLADTPSTESALLGNRKTLVDSFLQARIPELLQ